MSMVAEPPVNQPAPERISRYHLLQRIGRGASGNLYSAVDEATGQQVAVKVLATDIEDDPEMRERFCREANVTRQLTHRNIVAVLDVGEDNGRLFLVMELLRGLPLGEYLRQHRSLSLGDQLSLMIQLFEGLQAAHERGIVHRDVKPGNLFVQEDGVLKILDFGLARLQASTLTASGVIMGTPEFMSPEQAEGRRVDARSDIFSAAAVCYLILTDRAPFSGRDLPAMLHALIHDDPPPIADRRVPKALDRALFKGLAKDPMQRHQTCREMVVDLAQVGGSAPGLVGCWAAILGMVGL